MTPPLRLINTETFELQTHDEVVKIVGECPPYAILSHTWNDGTEVNFAQYEKLRKCKLIKEKPPLGYDTGLGKIWWSCVTARKQGISYIWNDTCCIDKTNSNELNEAIRSMFDWYQEATVCYTFIADACEPAKLLRQSDHAFLDTNGKPKRWFTRGWTLQELLAPKRMYFYNAEWQLIGERQELEKQISAATKIDSKYLGPETFREASLATRMSWASRRSTAKEEDRVYSLFGIFNVAIDIRYGEKGPTAFQRLQCEIIRSSPDETIFAWRSNKFKTSGMLASWLDSFANAGDIKFYKNKYRHRGPYQMTNQGLEFPAPACVVGVSTPSNILYAIQGLKKEVKLALYAWRWNEQTGREENVTIKLRRTGRSSLFQRSNCFQRINCNDLGSRNGVKIKFKLCPMRRTKLIYVPTD